MKQLHLCYAALLAIVLLAATPRLSAQSELRQKITALPGLSQVEPLETTEFAEKYVVRFTQPLDHANPAKGSFLQRVFIAHVGFDRPTVIITEGYGGGYALRPKYREELSKLFNANMIVVEHRYFLESTPKPRDWQYLTAENSAYDLHTVTTALKTLYPGKWISTGISKGGQTTMLYRAFFPDDVDVSVPYVAPLCNGLEDGRHEPFLHQVGSDRERAAVEAFQLEALKRKATLLPLFKAYCQKEKLQFRARLEEIYDYCVLEYSFSFWQWGTKMEKIPALSASDDEVYQHLTTISDPGYFKEESGNTSFFVQAARELGYYGYDVKPFAKYLSVKSAQGYLHRLMVPEELKEMTFDETLGRKVTTFLKENDVKIAFIYGQNDPWTAAGVTWLKGKENMHLFVQPGGSHLARIGTLPADMRQQAVELIRGWIEE